MLVENPVNITEVVLLDGFSITCEATGNPEPTYYWYKDGILSYKDTASELSISEAKPSDRGYYYCEARNDGGNSTSKSGLVLIQGLKAFTSQCTVCESMLLFKGYFSVKRNSYSYNRINFSGLYQYITEIGHDSVFNANTTVDKVCKRILTLHGYIY